MEVDFDIFDVNTTRGPLRETALTAAARWGHPKTVRALLKCKNIDCNKLSLSWDVPIGEQPYQYGSTALKAAAFRGHTETVRALLECKDIDCNNQGHYPKLSPIQVTDGYTALMSAAFQGHPETVKALLDKYEDGLATASIGKSYTECFDLATATPTDEHVSFVGKIKKELSNVSIPL